MLCYRRFTNCTELFGEFRFLFNKEADEAAQLRIIRTIGIWINLHCFGDSFPEDAQQLIEIFANFAGEQFRTFLQNAVASAMQQKVSRCAGLYH